MNSVRAASKQLISLTIDTEGRHFLSAKEHNFGGVR